MTTKELNMIVSEMRGDYKRRLMTVYRFNREDADFVSRSRSSLFTVRQVCLWLSGEDDWFVPPSYLLGK